MVKNFQLGNWVGRNQVDGDFLDSIKKAWNSEVHPISGIAWLEVESCITLYSESIDQILIDHMQSFVQINDSELAHATRGMKFVSNLIDDSLSRIALHTDSKSSLPTILTSINPTPALTREGGELFLYRIGFALKYSDADVVLMDGSVEHCVLTMRKMNNIKACYRFSCVKFNNKFNPGNTKHSPHRNQNKREVVAERMRKRSKPS